MPVRRSVLATILSIVLATSTALAADTARLHGVVADESGGVLPGVTVTASAPDGRVLASTVTDEVGRFAFRALPASDVRLTFHLEGFSNTVVDLAAVANADTLVPTPRLKLGSKSETVDVHGGLPIDPQQPPPRAVSSPAIPRPVVRVIPDHDHDSVCGPSKPAGSSESFGTIRARRASPGNGLFGAGDEVLIDGGTATGLAVGQNLVARRAYRTSADPDGMAGEHTAGVLQIVEASERSATAMVVYACDEMMAGDWLVPFRPEPRREPEPAGAPAYDRAAKILLTDAGQLIGAPRRLMVIDQGRDNGVRVGEQLTLFRPAGRGARGPAVIGDAVVVAVRGDSATIRVQHAIDIITIGDSAAPQRP